MTLPQYKYQLLYVFMSRAESGGRMWKVYVNRLLACCILMQLLMIISKSYFLSSTCPLRLYSKQPV